MRAPAPPAKRIGRPESIRYAGRLALLGADRRVARARLAVLDVTGNVADEGGVLVAGHGQVVPAVGAVQVGVVGCAGAGPQVVRVRLVDAVCIGHGEPCRGGAVVGQGELDALLVADLRRGDLDSGGRGLAFEAPQEAFRSVHGEGVSTVAGRG